MFEAKQGKIIEDYSEWEDLYADLLKGCSVKTSAPRIIDFDKQTLLAVFAGSSCSVTKVDVMNVTQEDNRIFVHSVVTPNGCTLPSISYPLTLVAVDKIDLPVEFTFESVQ